MAGFTASNDTGASLGKIRFKTCQVSFIKNKPTDWPEDKFFKLSQLINIKLGKHKDKVICFCDGYIEIIKKKKEEVIYVEDVEEEKYEPVELEHQTESIDDLNEIKSEREFFYHKEKARWIATFSCNERLRVAVREGYSCDEQYCEERLSQEMPGFFIVDETTVFWKNPYPTLEAIHKEKSIQLQLGSQKNKYGTYSRICLLEEHNNEDYNDSEAIVIFNYLNKFDIIACLDTLYKIDKMRKEINEQQLECGDTEILSD